MSKRLFPWSTAALGLFVVLSGLLTGAIYQAHRRIELPRRLLAAVQAGDVGTVNALLTEGADPNTRETDPPPRRPWYVLLLEVLHIRRPPPSVAPYPGRTALMLAVHRGDLACVRTLLRHGARATLSATLVSAKLVSANYQGDTVTPLVEALSAFDQNVSSPPEIIPLLLQAGADPNGPLLNSDAPLIAVIEAVSRPAPQRVALARDLLAHGADVNNVNSENGATALWTATTVFVPFATTPQSREMLRLLLDHGAKVNHRMTADDPDSDGPPLFGLLHLPPAATQALLPLLLARGADVNAKNGFGQTALMVAAESDPTAVRLLLDAGASVHGRDTGGWQGSGRTVVMHAAYGYRGGEGNTDTGDTECLRLLLAHGAAADARGYSGLTPLMQVVQTHTVNHDERRQALSSTLLLISAGAKVNARDQDGKTPLMLLASQAVVEGRFDLRPMARLLLAHGADPRLRDRRGHTALALARLKHLPRLAAVLQGRLYQRRRTP